MKVCNISLERFSFKNLKSSKWTGACTVCLVYAAEGSEWDPRLYVCLVVFLFKIIKLYKFEGGIGPLILYLFGKILIQK